ncbi:hypothetical protein T484DRAFT_1766594 [Baffinella frigidus]|nr:hypothetical protein T484DRAFT_1766594 [Cryptophyta sp. CCMP2293]
MGIDSRDPSPRVSTLSSPLAQVLSGRVAELFGTERSLEERLMRRLLLAPLDACAQTKVVGGWAVCLDGPAGQNFDVEMARGYGCFVDVFDHSVEVMRNEVGLPEHKNPNIPAGAQPKFRFHSAGDTIARGEGWRLQGLQGLSSGNFHTSKGTAAVERPLAPLRGLIRNYAPTHCKAVRGRGTVGCQVDILRFNCQGCEWDAVEQMFESDPSILLSVDQVLIEIHLGSEKEHLQPCSDDPWLLRTTALSAYVAFH